MRAILLTAIFTCSLIGQQAYSQQSGQVVTSQILSQIEIDPNSVRIENVTMADEDLFRITLTFNTAPKDTCSNNFVGLVGISDINKISTRSDADAGIVTEFFAVTASWVSKDPDLIDVCQFFAQGQTAEHTFLLSVGKSSSQSLRINNVSYLVSRIEKKEDGIKFQTLEIKKQ